MQIYDHQVVSVVENIVDHYHTNIDNPFVRPALMRTADAQQQLRIVENLMRTAGEIKGQVAHVDDLVQLVDGLAQFVVATRVEVLPNLRSSAASGGGSANERVLRDMALRNFPANLDHLGVLVGRLYDALCATGRLGAKTKKRLAESVATLHRD